MKKCNLCDLEKELINFKKDKRRSDGCTNTCKSCIRLKSSEYYHRTKDIRREKINENSRRSHHKNKTKENLKSKEYRLRNPEKIKSYNENYRHINKEKVNKLSRDYRVNNLDQMRLYQKQYLKDRLRSDILFKLSHYTRGIIRKSLKRNGYSKTSKTHFILGCSFDEFKFHLESKFEIWMSWENYGLYNGQLNYGWDIDHIIPLSSAKTEQQVVDLNHYTNLQPLCSKINRYVKKDNIN